MANQFGLNALSGNKSAPKFSFSHDALGKEATKKTPAPGAYNTVGVYTDKFAKSSSWTMLGASDRGVATRSWQPGPGAYAQNKEVLNMTAPKWAFGSENRMQDKKKMKVPGPGTYDTRIAAAGADQVSITMSPKFSPSKKGTGPAPTSYKPNHTVRSDMPLSQRMTFGSSTRTDLKDLGVPGPGRYEAVKPEVKGNRTAPCYSMRPKYQDPKKPFPGASYMSAMTSFK